MDASPVRVITHCAQLRRNFVSNSPTQHALRETRQIFAKPIAQIILIAVIVLLGVSGPFGTLEAISFGPRLAYWAVIVPVTFAVGMCTSAFIVETFRAHHSPWPTRIGVPVATAFTVATCVTIINMLAFGTTLLVAQLGSVAVTAGVIAVVIQMVSDQSQPESADAPAPATLLQRLDLEKRGALISMSVQDHYVEVTTSAGTSLLLMRLSDAIRETGDIAGLQVHRSHWVATAHVVKAKRDGDKAILTLSDGRTLPASRSRIKDLKAAGILPV